MHRTSHGTHGAGDIGNKELADSLMVQLKHAYPRVFADPTFPIEREDPDFYHRIRLIDVST